MRLCSNLHTNDLKRVLYALLLCFLLTSCASSRIIVNAIDEREANEILVFLSGKGISAKKVQNVGAGAGGGGGAAKIVLWDIQVPEEQATEAMYLLNQAGLPRRRGQSLLNIFAGGGLVPSELQEKIRYQAGLAEQIASTIRKIDGVLDAEVQISFPEENPLKPVNEQKKKITASVYVKHNGVLDDPNAHLVDKIKRLVASSVPGLDYDNVTVIGDRARYTALPEGGFGGLGEEEKQFVSIWGVVLAKESISLFRTLFFSFIILLLLLIVSLVWILWKTHPLLKSVGGMKELFHVHPLEPGKQPSDETPVQEETPGEKAEDKEKADREIDET